MTEPIQPATASEDAVSPDLTPVQAFAAQVERLRQEGKLSAEEAAGLLGTPDAAHADPFQPASDMGTGDRVAPDLWSGGDPPPNLRLEVSGYTLQVVPGQGEQPELHASEPEQLEFSATPEGWHLRRRPGQPELTGRSLRAVLSVPWTPHDVQARVDGGQLTLPDLAGTLRAEVNGGAVRLGHAAGLHADVNGGSLSAAQVAGPTRLSVNGGSLSLEGAQSLQASVNGGSLRWAGALTGGEHRLDVNAGSATLHLDPRSSLRVQADVTVGSFRADFPTRKSGNVITTHHTGQLGTGEAKLSVRVAAGQVRLT